ncbi:MAG: carboxypeptidase regulatory-like domain-containing protein [Blastocatellales bacterium]|nr:carboxypeptidase regulatory-like domain-containing protein [Blastocatellales bacterium]
MHLRSNEKAGSAMTGVLGALMFAVISAGAVFAQTSTIRGTAVDPQGQPIAGAVITISDSSKNFARTQTSNQSGGYVFSALPPGVYRLEAEAHGFKKLAVAEVRALVDTPTDLTLTFEVGAVTDVVNVSGAAELPLNTTDATIGNAFENRRIVDLPLNARNIVGLLSLQAGVTRGGFVNGTRADQSNILLDGVDVNEQQSGLNVITAEAFASVLRVTPDSVQEFRVVTTNPNADVGRSSGAQVSLVTRSGSNQFHGSLYEFHRNTITTANDFFNNKAGRFTATDREVIEGLARVGDEKLPRPQLLRNIFGGAVGGPVRKDRLFFFFNYEGFREATATGVAPRIVPLAHMGQGIIRYETTAAAGGVPCPTRTNANRRCTELRANDINAAYIAANGVTPGVNQAAIAYLADVARRYPANDTTVGDGLNTGGFRFNAKTPTSLNTYIARFDAQVNDKQSLFARLNYQSDNVGLAPDFPDLPAPTVWNHPMGLAVGHTWTVSNSVLNKFSYGITRAAFSQQGDSSVNEVAFRFIFDPTPTRTLSRVTPVHNFVDDVSWVKGNHTIQFGGNVRLIENRRDTFANSFDFATTNPSGYAGSGAVLINAGADGTGPSIFSNVAPSSQAPLGNALAAFIGRFSEYSANLLYGPDGNLLPGGSSAARNFATQEYEAYAQDSWRLRPNLTLSYGLRYSTSTPVYEANGFQVKPTQSLSEFFDRRVAGANQGAPYNELITLDLAGKVNNRPGFYAQDWNNFAPSVAVAWSPDFGDNLFGKLFGRGGKGVIRGGFRMTYDRIGSQLAVSFDLNNTLGFASAVEVNPNTFNLSTNLGPLFTGNIPDVRTLPLIGNRIANRISFPLTHPADDGERIEFSLDDGLRTPYSYNFNLSYGREIGRGLSVEASYVGRFSRDLLAQRDVMHFNNIRDPQSGVSWYEAMRQLIELRYRQTPITSVQPIPFFENIFPGIGGTFNVLGQSVQLTPTQRMYRQIAVPAVDGRNTLDYTFLQSNLVWNNAPFAFLDNTFVHPQYAALSVFSTIATSNYNSAQFSIRERLKEDLTFDFNYTLSHSLDNASGLQNANAFSGSALIFNPLDLRSNYANSDFDVRHSINANWVAGLPFGRGKALWGNAPKFANAVVGGWSLSGVFRWNSGFPINGDRTAAAGAGTSRPFAFRRWGTNWQSSSGMVRVRPLESSPSKDVNGEPNLFSDPQFAFLSFRDPFPGEPGDRNVFRQPGYVALDLGLHKTFNLPIENHKLTFRWEVFNVTNTQRFTAPSGAGFGLSPDPFLLGGTPPADFGKFTATQTPLNETKAGRIMQFALRYTF